MTDRTSIDDKTTARRPWPVLIPPEHMATIMEPFGIDPAHVRELHVDRDGISVTVNVVRQMDRSEVARIPPGTPLVDVIRFAWDHGEVGMSAIL